MATATYRITGEAPDYVNETDEVLEPDVIVSFGSRIGVTTTRIMPGQTGAINTEGVYEMPKGDADIARGAEVYWDEAAEQIVASGDLKAGYAIAAAPASASTVLVKINA